MLIILCVFVYQEELARNLYLLCSNDTFGSLYSYR